MMATMTLNQTTDAPSAITATDTAAIVAGSAVLTLSGVMPVEYLQPGDRIVTRGGAARLKALVATRYSGPAYVVQGGSIGHMLPGEDSILTPKTRILVRDWRAQALFGQDVALASVEALCDGEYVREIVATDLPMFTLVFDTDHVVYAAGMELAAFADTTAKPVEVEDMLDAIRMARAA